MEDRKGRTAHNRTVYAWVVRTEVCLSALPERHIHPNIMRKFFEIICEYVDKTYINVIGKIGENK
ncbi:hypothetical protein Holit_02700 [Hollandina sp. SP2]